MSLFGLTAEQLLHIWVLPFLVVAVYTDLRLYRIPNRLTFSAMVTGLCLQAFLFGWPGLVLAFAGMGVGLVALLPFYMLGGMGAGDVKLIAAIGTFLGPLPTLFVVVSTFIIGGMIGIGVLMSRLGFTVPLLFIESGLIGGFRDLLRLSRTSSKQVIYFPFAPAIALGTAGVLFWQF